MGYRFIRSAGIGLLLLSGMVALSGLKAGAVAGRPPAVKLPERPDAVYNMEIADSCHSQGIAMDEKYFYVSCVDTRDKQAFLYRIDRTGPAGFRRKNITAEKQYHPSGIDLKDNCVWVAVSEYHPAPAQTTISCVDRDSLEIVPALSFKLDDHIGALAAAGDYLIAFNWGAKNYYLLDYKGGTVSRGDNPGDVAYQDCKFLKDNRVLCSGVKGKLMVSGEVDELEISAAARSSVKIVQSIGTPKAPGAVYPVSQEGMAWFGSSFYFFPKDFPNPAVFRYDAPGFIK
jgi:hypothetical protein